jgi:hypothetical protein
LSGVSQGKKKKTKRKPREWIRYRELEGAQGLLRSGLVEGKLEVATRGVAGAPGLEEERPVRVHLWVPSSGLVVW